MILLDIEKAFDTIWHEGLLHKLLKFGFPMTLIKIVQSFLTERLFYVNIYGGNSKHFSIPAGLPQGSSLSPWLYNIYTADMKIPRGSDLAQFADDTGIMCSGKKPETITKALERSYKTLSKYCHKWRIQINEKKTDAIFFSKRRASRFLPSRNINLNGSVIPWSRFIKYLGVLLDCKLLYTLFNKKSKLSFQNKMLLFKSSFRPVLLYEAPVWGGCANSHLNGLQVAQNKCLKMVVNKPFYYSTRKLHEGTRISYVRDVISAQSVRFISKCECSANPLISGLPS